MENDPLGKKRSEGACTALDKHNDSEVLFVDVKNPDEISVRGYQVGSEIVHMKERPTAIIAHDDMLAFGIISAIKAEGLRVPEDIAIVGFNDMANISAYYDPPLTSIRPPYAEMGEAAVGLLVDMIDGRLAQDAGTKILLNPSLIARRSSGASKD
jgi:DNA-binding LacI/PurR family transcriptional regulator